METSTSNIDIRLAALQEEAIERITFCSLFAIDLFSCLFALNVHEDLQTILGSEVIDSGYILKRLPLISEQTSVIKIKFILFSPPQYIHKHVNFCQL